VSIVDLYHTTYRDNKTALQNNGRI